MRDYSLNLFLDCRAVFVKTARNDGKETLVFKGFLCCERQLLVFKSPFDEDGSAASDDIAVFAHNGGFVVVVVVVVKGVKDIFYACCYRSHTLVYAHRQAKVAYEIGFELLARYAVYFIKHRR